MREQRDAPAGERPPQRRLRQQAVDAEPHDVARLAKGAGPLQPQDEAVGVVKVRPAGRVAQRPVRQRAVIGLDHRRQGETERGMAVARRESIERDERVELEPVAVPAHDDRGRQPIVAERSAVAIRAERVDRPLAGGREVELVVRGIAVTGDEGLEAGVTPEVVTAPALADARNAQPREVALEAERQRQRPVVIAVDVCVDLPDGNLARLGVRREPLGDQPSYWHTPPEQT